MKIYTYLFFFIFVFGLISCGPTQEEILAEDLAEITDYLSENGLLDDAILSSTDFYYIIDAEGNPGKVPSLNSLVTCNYRGFYPNGEEFDASDGAEFVLGNTVEGWRQGIPLIGEGGSIQLFLPSYLCYGTSGRGSIPGNQVLFFEVDLLKVE
jgi:FKBP-type peptidyl-prolyl cis-trans isomerase FkpA